MENIISDINAVHALFHMGKFHSLCEIIEMERFLNTPIISLFMWILMPNVIFVPSNYYHECHFSMLTEILMETWTWYTECVNSIWHLSPQIQILVLINYSTIII